MNNLNQKLKEIEQDKRRLFLNYKKERHLELLKRSEELKSLSIDSSEEARELSRYYLKEYLLNAADTQFYYNVSHLSGTDREAVIFAINFGYGDYPIPNHGAMFENKGQYEFHAFISDYAFTNNQVQNFNASLLTDPVIGIRRTPSPTQSSTQNSTTLEPEI